MSLFRRWNRSQRASFLPFLGFNKTPLKFTRKITVLALLEFLVSTEGRQLIIIVSCSTSSNGRGMNSESRHLNLQLACEWQHARYHFQFLNLKEETLLDSKVKLSGGKQYPNLGIFYYIRFKQDTDQARDSTLMFASFSSSVLVIFIDQVQGEK